MKPATLAVLEALRARPFAGLSPAEALNGLGCFRLAARISELRAIGFDITTTYETRRGVTYARYHLITAARAGREGSAPTSSASRPARAALVGDPR